MKNLELLEIQKNEDSIFDGATNFSHHEETVYFLQSGYIYKHDFKQKLTIQLCDKKFFNVSNLKILTIENKICVTANNVLYIANANEFSNENQVGCIDFDNKIEAIEWNLSEEIVAIVYSNGSVATYFINFIDFVKIPQGESSVEAGVPEALYVGWGSKNTQFRGSEGKLKSDKQETKNEPIYDKKPIISWRGNGEMFVVNYWKNLKRMFMVFELPCKAIYHSEECFGLECIIAWRPTGNMIATIAGRENGKNVVIFEKNAQKRFTFNITKSVNEEIINLKWSPCARILAIQTLNSITLLTTSNFKWYKKIKLHFNSDGNNLLSFDWVQTTQFTSTIQAVTNQKIIRYTFKYAINKSEKCATCAVINGNCIHLTFFDTEIIPPGLSSIQLQSNNQINFIIFNHNDNKLFAIIDCENILTIFKHNSVHFEQTSTLNLNNMIDHCKIPLNFHHFLWRDNRIFLVVENKKNCIASINLDNEICDILNPNVDCTRCSIAHMRNLIALNDLTIDDISSSSIQLKEMHELEFSIIQLSYKCIDGQLFIFILTSASHFYINATKISDSVNSFLISQNYLLVTLKQNELFSVRITQQNLNLLLDKRELNKNYFHYRSIEQGAVLVTAIRDSPNLILQMPRGNIETVSSRLISIDILNELLNQEKWSNAIYFMRNEKLNANLLFDLNPNRFLDNIPNFVCAAKSVNILNNICLEFKEINVLETVYKHCISEVTKFTNKCRTIFEKMLNYFESIDYASYISTITVITLHFFTIKKSFTYIQDLYERSKFDVKLKQSVINAINILKTYNIDDDALYGQALLSYDLDLARFVANSCQMDPRIYNPQLIEYSNLPEIEKRFKINVFMKQPKIAISYLLRCPNKNSNDIVQFINAHKISMEAYKDCREKSPHYAAVSKCFANYLSMKGNNFEAAIVLKRAKLLKEAFELFKIGTNWREAMDLLQYFDLSDVEKLREYHDLCAKLIKNGKFKEAAHIYEYYINNHEEAIKILNKNLLFVDALHIANKFKRRDILVSDIIPAIISYGNYLKEHLNEMRSNFEIFKSRLLIVRDLKVNNYKIDAELDFKNDYQNKDNDLFSDTDSILSKTSTRTSRSRSSTTSSKNRRKEERKKQDLREGGFYEDIALIRALHILIREIYDKSEEVKNICCLLLSETEVSYGDVKQLNDEYLRLLDNVNESVSIIWPNHFYIHNPTEVPEQMADIENIEHLDIVYRTPPIKPNSWSLDFFK